MINNNKSIDSYFESAKKFKSPVSTDKARCIVESSDAKKPDSIPYFSRKGVKIMTYSSLIISSFLFLSIYLGIFQNSAQNVIIESIETKNTKIESKSNLIAENIQARPVENTKATGNGKDIEKSEKLNENTTIKIQGMNTIRLTKKELEEFGIKYDSVLKDNIFYPGIAYWSKMGMNNYTHSVYSIGSGSTHKIGVISEKEKINFIKIDPVVLTDFKGTGYSYSYYPKQMFKIVNEFISFSNVLLNFLDMTFHLSNFPTQIPKNIDIKLSELENLLIDYQSSKNNDIELNKNIENKFTELLQYFKDLKSKYSVNTKLNEVANSDTNSKIVMYMYLDHDPNSNDSLEIINYEKMGIKIIYTKNPPSIRQILENKYPKLADLTSKIKKQIENYFLSNNLIAIEVPLKNDSKNGFIFWYIPNQDLIDALPERFRSGLAKEFKLLQNEEAVCGAVIDAEKLYLDVWRACSGAIENLRIFPNPVKNNLNIKFELKEDRKLTYSLHDLNGNKISDLHNNQINNLGTNTLSFDLSKIKTGMYLLVVSSDKGENAVQRLIKE